MSILMYVLQNGHRDHPGSSGQNVAMTRTEIGLVIGQDTTR